MSGDAFRDRITEVIHESDLYVRDSDDGILGAGLTSDAILAMPEMQALLAKDDEIERLRAAGDALAEALTLPFALSSTAARDAWTAWQEARHER